jgi:uncharacterized membrane protein
MTSSQAGGAAGRIDSPPRAVGSRIFGIDLARGLAILGMFVIHAAPALTDGSFLDRLFLLSEHQRAQVLFAVLDGIALGLLTGGVTRTPVGPARGAKRREIVVRAVFLVALGLILTSLGSRVIVILDYYGVYFFLTLPVLFLRSRWLVSLGAVLLVAGPWMRELALQAPVAIITQPGPLHQVSEWLFTGTYPACIWLGYVYIGLAVARLGLTDRAVLVRVFAIGAVVMVACYVPAFLLHHRVAEPFYQSLLYAGSTGFALALVTFAIFVTTSGIRWLATSSRFVFIPVAAMGALPITVYSLHVLYLAIVDHFTTLGVSQPWPVFWVLVLGALLFATLWHFLLGKGPLERLVRWMMGTVATPARWN